MKKHVLFVDDEPAILNGLRRTFRVLRDEWDMSFAGSGSEALEQLEICPFDAVVSDMKMPEMDGAELLSRVKEKCPQAVRIVLSGQSDAESILRSVGSAHQYVAKPCEPDRLKAVISRTLSLRGILEDDTLRALVGGLETLPSLPALYGEVVRAMQAPYASLKDVGRVIAKDIGLSAKVLQMVNSAFFGLQRRLSSMEEAVVFLGLQTITSLVISLETFSRFKLEPSARLDADVLWRHSLQTGLLAREIAVVEGLQKNETDEAYLAGLLHDAGKLILAHNMPERFGAVQTLSRQRGISAAQMERSELGASHGGVGAYLLGLWGLSDAILEAVALHSFPSEAHGDQFGLLAAVHAACAIQQSLTGETGGEVPLEGLDREFLERLGLSGREVVWRRQCAG
ncbi:MAG: response regulator, partial [Acidobacteriota bacterium]